MNTKDRYCFRRQFLFTDKEIRLLPYWRDHKIVFKGKVSNLIFHPDLDFSKSEGQLSIVLLGYILDPFNPDQGNQEVVDNLARCDTIKEAFRKTDFMNGRYVMIVSDGRNHYIINDSTASKQIYYYFSEDGNFAIGSTPNIITNYFECAKTNNQDLLKYLNSERYLNHNKSWFGVETQYKDIYLLLPNHYLDVDNKTSGRFWPVTNSPAKETKEAIKYIAEIMRGTIESASKRYTLHCSLTGGWDSRMILAASKYRISEMEFYTFRHAEHYKKNIWDIFIPQKLADKFQLKHSFIHLDGSLPEKEFLEVFKLNSIFNRNVYAEIYYKYILNGHDTKMNVTGIMGDQILRVFYRFEGEITAEKFADKFHERKNPYVVNSIRKWLDDVNPIVPEFDYHIIDWFNWEHYFGIWGGISATEHDIARDELRIFNCRELLSTFMRIDEKLRYRDNPIAHKMIIKQNWAELLEERIEPSNIQYRIQKKILRFLKLEQTAERLYKLLKYKLSRNRV